MTNFYISAPEVRYHDESIKQSTIAALQANQAYFYKNIYYRYEMVLRKWEELMCNSPIIMHTMLFLIFFVADIIVSWQMNRDIMDSVQFFSYDPPSWAILLLCMLINGWAAVTGHFVGKGWSKDIQDWERWNITYIKYGGEVAEHTADADIRREIWWARFYALLSSVILFILVGLIIRHRLTILSAESDLSSLEDNDISSVAFNPIVIVFFPVAILLGEFVTGFYIIYIIQRLWQKWKRTQNRRRFIRYKINCGEADKRSHEYHEAAKKNGETLSMVADLEASLKRFTTRTQEKDEYIDPILLKKASFVLYFMPSGRPVVNQFVYGILANGAKTGHHRTNEHGNVTVLWSGVFDKIELLHIPGYPTQAGPFYEHSEHIIEIPDSIPVSSNGNGLHESIETT